MRAEDVVVERAGGRAPHGTPRRRVVDEPQEHVWSADLRQGCDELRDAGYQADHAADGAGIIPKWRRAPERGIRRKIDYISVSIPIPNLSTRHATSSGTRPPRWSAACATRNPPRLAPRPGPEPGPEPQPSPPRLDPGLRISGCRSELICFDPGKYDEIEYRRQLKIQQDGINAKSSCKNKNDIERYDNFTPQEKRRQRERADYENDEYFTPNYLLRHHGFSMNGKDALHRIDMVAGGYEKDFADMGDSKINQSIGPSWRADSCKGKLKRYADEMCSKGCRMSVTIDICESVLDNGQIA